MQCRFERGFWISVSRRIMIPVMSEAIEFPIDGTLDLHSFRPEEARELVQDYLGECRKRGILQVRIIHGKGIGTLREIVHATLARIPEVASYRLADEASGGWGATLVTLQPTPEQISCHGLTRIDTDGT